MKLIVVDNNFAPTPPAVPLFSGIADTALLLKNKPFFIPEFAQPCVARLYLVVQICRLGRSISERFAHRYYNKATVGVIFTAQNLWDEALRQGNPPDYARSFDGAAAVGQWIDIPVDTQSFDLLVRSNKKDCLSGTTSTMHFSIDSLIAHISRFQLLRQGDLLFIGSPTTGAEVHIDDHLDGFINGQAAFSFNIK